MVKLATPLQAAYRNLRGQQATRVPTSTAIRLLIFVSLSRVPLRTLRPSPFQKFQALDRKDGKAREEATLFKGQVHEQGALIRCDAVHWMQGM